MVRPRRTTTPRPTPYDRPLPRLSPKSTPQHPNWLSRLLATGAGKVFSSVFGSDYSSSSGDEDDYDEEEDRDNDSTSEGEMEDIIEDDDDGSNSSQSGEKNKTTEIVNYSRKDLPAVEWRTGTMRLIAQLLMQETFSRAECDRLTHIIESRVVDSPIIRGTEGGRLSEVPDKTVGNDVDTPDLHNTAVKEAKKWFKGKKLGPNSPSVECGICTLNTAPHVTEGEAGSPVDLAKSYMRARPPWASPSTNLNQLQFPSSMGKELFKEATPFLAGGKSLSPSKLNWDSPFTRSWNIQEELHKVRSRATEEMLRARLSSKIDWSALSSTYTGGPSLLGDGEFVGAKVSQIAQDRLQNEAFPPNTATSVPEKSQDMGSTPTIEGSASAFSIASESSFLFFFPLESTISDSVKPFNIGLLDGSEVISCHEQKHQPSEEVIVKQSAAAYITAAAAAHGLKDNEDTSNPLSSAAERTVQDSLLHEVNYSASKEVAGRGDVFATNGFPSASSLPAVHDREQKSTSSSKEHNLVGPGHDRLRRTASGEETCELLSEASMEVPNVNENVSFANDSKDSSSMYQEGLALAVARRNSKRWLVSRTTGVSEKQQGRNISSRDNGRGGGRGK